jgi:hypothetical protein
MDSAAAAAGCSRMQDVDAGCRMQQQQKENPAIDAGRVISMVYNLLEVSRKVFFLWVLCIGCDVL